MDILGVIVDLTDECGRVVLTHVNKVFAHIVRGRGPRGDVCAQAADNAQFEVLKWAFAAGYPMFITPLGAAAHGDIEMIEWIHDIDVRWSREIAYEMYKRAAAAGQLDTLKWLYAHEYDEIRVYTIHKAARRGHRHVPEWFIPARKAARHGHRHVLEWLIEVGCVLDEIVFARAAKGGHFELMKWLYERRCPYNYMTMNWAAFRGDLNTLKWLRDIGCPMKDAYCIGAGGGRLEILKWLRDEGIDIPDDSFMTQSAASGGHIHVLEWLLEINYPISRRGYFHATRTGSVDVFKWLLEKNIEMGGEYMCQVAASAGQLDMLKWLRAEGYHWDKSVCSSAVSKSHVDVLKWAIENGCPYDLGECIDQISRAYNYGKIKPNAQRDLETVQYLHDLGCRFDRPVLCARAAALGNLEMLKSLRKYGCPWDTITCKYARRSDPRMIKWIHANGCPCKHTMSRRERSRFYNMHDMIARDDLRMFNCVYRRLLVLRQSMIHTACCIAVKYRRLRIIEWLHSYVPTSGVLHYAACSAAIRGYRDVLVWLLDFGYHIDSAVFSQAVRGGHFELLKWLYERSPKPCAWDEHVPAMAAKANKIAIIKWLFEKGCPFDSGTSYYALSGGHLRLSQWLYEHGFEPDADGIREAKKRGHQHVLDWLAVIGYTGDL